MEDPSNNFGDSHSTSDEELPIKSPTPEVDRDTIMDRLSELHERRSLLLDVLRQANVLTSISFLRTANLTHLRLILHEKLVDPTSADADGNTLLHYAAMDGRSGVASLLLRHGASLSAQNNDGMTPHDVAIMHRQPFMMHLLSRPLCGISPPETGLSLLEIVPIPEAEPTPLSSAFSTVWDVKSVVICLVGLPGRGKSFISERICRYLNWKGVPCRVFNAGDYRRKHLGAATTSHADYYDDNNPVAKAERENMAHMACEDAVSFLGKASISVSIVDATNTTVKRRRDLVNFFSLKCRTKPTRVIFVESICTDQAMVLENIMRAKLGNADFKNVRDPEVVVNDFLGRIRNYERVYVPITDEEGLSYVKIINMKEQFIQRRVRGGIPSRVAYFLLNLHHVGYTMFLVPQAETMGDVDGVFGDNRLITEEGRAYATAVAKFLRDRNAALDIMSSPHPAAALIVKNLQDLEGERNVSPDLDAINCGAVSGFTVHDVFVHQPAFAKSVLGDLDQLNPALTPKELLDEFMKRMAYTMTFPRGESRRLVNIRLDAAIMGVLSRPRPVAVVASPWVLQGLWAFFTDVLPELSGTLAIPPRSVVEVGAQRSVKIHPIDVCASP